MAYDVVLAERIRDRLRDSTGITEKRMFGSLVFLTHGHLTVGVSGDDLIARIGTDQRQAALSTAGVRPFDLTGRPMNNWILVAGEVLDDAVLDRWLAAAGRFVAGLPVK